ncbi:hypothetical protein INS49_009038 [Diaporthe citri]|uniref:uncharacterized protein n=1 Tax=Diaporthe citri TaxID=83186 RepID=UPI001C7EEDF0|nr:uncharacterized protein INS49_009038 [Diaporthe citri]KAG6363935.1 hypothetical protein INS49_009038 [Diaporthe citri]
MDPVSIIGITAAAVQFADVGKRLLSRFHEIDGRTDQEREALTLLGDLRQMAAQTLDHPICAKHCRMMHDQTRVFNSDENPTAVLQEVESIPTEFEGILTRLAARSDVSGEGGSKRVSKSLGAAAGSMYDEGMVKKLRARLDETEKRAIRFTILSLWIQTKESAIRVEQFGSRINDVLDTNELLNDDDVNVGARVYRELVQELWMSARSPKLEPAKVADDFALNIQCAISRGLVSGVFDEISNREKLIADAYENTFSWVFQKTPVIEAGKHLWSSFPKWLEGNDKSVFWITGKPGSGKSTLMKFILSSDELRKFLEKWAAGLPLQVTNFYAWVAGSDLQKSHLGLMRTVLHQCLQSNPGLASAVAPRRWALFSTLRSCEKQPTWEEWELKESFEYLLSGMVKTHRLAFFIDGLDEFEVSPAHTLALVKDIGARDGIKVCVASRQWREFNDELGKYPVLRMQDLTEEDMTHFVRGTFSSNRGFQEQIHIFPDEVESIILEIVNKSSGVFLWSYLVVKNLSEAFTDGEGLLRLKEILHSLPEDLKDLYTSIWGRMGHRSRDFAKLMALFRASEGPLHLLNLWVADGGPQGLTGFDLLNLSVVRLSGIRSQVIRRLDSHTRGILELSKDDNVELLHRTTLDWAKREEIWSDISSHLDADFDPFIELIEAEGIMTRRRLRHIDMPWRQSEPDPTLTQRIYEVLRYANKVRPSVPNTQRLVQILDDFDKDMTDTWSPMGGNRDAMGNKIRNSDWPYYQGPECDFLGLTARYCADTRY